MALKALIWDVDGTIAETERDGHRVAFNHAFRDLGLPWHWTVPAYGELLRITGGRERLLHFMKDRDDVPPSASEQEALVRDLHRRKNLVYASLVAEGGIRARPGVRRLMDECEHGGVLLAVATTTSASNQQALFTSLFGPRWRNRFAAVVCAADAPVKKPDPQVYRVALERLGVAGDEAFAVEDSPNGLAAARAAGIRCGITRSAYFAGADFEGATWVVDDLQTPAPMTLSRLRNRVSAKITPS